MAARNDGMPRRNGTTRLKRGIRKSALSVETGARQRFQHRLLKWYRQHGRDLPWRKTSDPYKILVSEIMLQQTQVERVLPKYQEWLTKYPTMEELAEASLSTVKKSWYPLGYNIRPVRLHAIARESVARYGGALPKDPERLRAFAFREDAPILDTNVMRVLHRVFVGKGDPKKQKSALWNLSEALIPKGKGYDFNQALMDFGAMVCTARDPYCLLCPMKDFCKTYPFDPKRDW